VNGHVVKDLGGIKRKELWGEPISSAPAAPELKVRMASASSRKPGSGVPVQAAATAGRANPSEKDDGSRRR
jgi:hypothetical protein